MSRGTFALLLLLAACQGQTVTEPSVPPASPWTREVGAKVEARVIEDGRGVYWQFWLVSGHSRCYVSPDRFDSTVLGQTATCFWEPAP